MDRRIRTPQDLGAALRDGRRARELTQAELARAAGVSREWLIGVEQGHRPRAELEKVLAVLAALGLPLIVGETPHPAAAPAPQSEATITARATREAIDAMRAASRVSAVAENGQRVARLLNAGVAPELAAHLARVSSTPLSSETSAETGASDEQGSM